MPIERYFVSLWPDQRLDVLATYTAEYAVYACLLLFVFAWARSGPRGAFWPFAIGAIAATILDKLAGASYYDPRPFVTLGIAPLVTHAADNGFPSDHTAVAAFVATAATFFDLPIGIFIWLVAIALGVARMYCLLHSPIDVVGGLLIGMIPALVAGFYWRGRSRQDRGGRP